MNVAFFGKQIVLCGRNLTVANATEVKWSTTYKSTELQMWFWQIVSDDKVFFFVIFFILLLLEYFI